MQRMNHTKVEQLWSAAQKTGLCKLWISWLWVINLTSSIKPYSGYVQEMELLYQSRS